jgi:hypothetical protein
VLVKRFADDARHRHPRIEACLRILEDHLHHRPLGAQAVAVDMGDFVAVDFNGAAGDIVEPQDRAPDGGFAASGFSDQAKRFAWQDVEADAVHRLDVTDMDF